MNAIHTIDTFESLNSGFNRTFKYGKLSLGLIAPLESYSVGEEPSLTDHIKRIQLAERLGFSAAWIRDVPFNVPAFGDAGQIYDPFVYLGMLAGQTSDIALGVASIILPLRHPAHVAKAAASIDDLSQGRLLLGVASGDRPEEYPALNVNFEQRGARFRDSYEYIRNIAEPYPRFNSEQGLLDGNIDLLPKPRKGKLPLLITGASQQNPQWLAENGDGWMTYPRNVSVQGKIIREWRARSSDLEHPLKPAMQSLYIDIMDSPDYPPEAIHLGFRSGVNYLIDYLSSLEQIGMNHVALNLRFNRANTEETMAQIAEQVLPHFHG